MGGVYRIMLMDVINHFRGGEKNVVVWFIGAYALSETEVIGAYRPINSNV